MLGVFQMDKASFDKASPHLCSVQVPFYPQKEKMTRDSLAEYVDGRSQTQTFGCQHSFMSFNDSRANFLHLKSSTVFQVKQNIYGMVRDYHPERPFQLKSPEVDEVIATYKDAKCDNHPDFIFSVKDPLPRSKITERTCIIWDGTCNAHESTMVFAANWARDFQLWYSLVPKGYKLIVSDQLPLIHELCDTYCYPIQRGRALLIPLTAAAPQSLIW